MIEMIAGFFAVLFTAWFGRGQIGRAAGEKSAAGWLWLAAIGLIGLGAVVRSTTSVDLDGVTRARVLLLDASGSISDKGWSEITRFAETWRQANPDGLVFAFGGGLIPLEGFAESADRTEMADSDLAGALMELEMLLGSRTADITILSDWQIGETALAASRLMHLAASGSRVWVVDLGENTVTKPLALIEFQVSEYVWEGDDFSGLLTVRTSESMTARLEVLANGQSLYDDELVLESGFQTLIVPVRAGTEGHIGLEARLIAAGQQTETRYASLQVRSAPRLLLVSEQIAGVARVAALLRDAGVEPTLVLPSQILTSVEELGRYDAILLNNLPATEVSGRAFDSIRWFVEARGGGLIVAGGNESFTLGGYEDSSIAGILPFAMDSPARGERPPLTLVLVMDRSGSMAGAENAPISLAQEAALRVVEELGDGDQFGLVSYADDVRWDVRVGPVGGEDSLRSSADAIAVMQAGGGTYMLAALEEAVLQASLLGSPNSTHVILLSDGISSDGEYEDFIRIANIAKSQGMTISAIALGDLSDVQTLTGIAGAGDGRYYYVENPVDLPDVVVAETRAARSENVQTGQTNLLGVMEMNPVLVEFSAGELPAINSYLALTVREGSGVQVYLQSGEFEDPLLAGWQVGNGRVIAWASDLGGAWSGAWQNWAGAGEFWARVAKYSASGTRVDGPLLEVQTAGEGASAILEVDGMGDDLPLAWIVMPDGSAVSRDVRPGGLSRYSIDLTGLVPGNYPLRVEMAGGEVLSLLSVNQESDFPGLPSAAGDSFVQDLVTLGTVMKVSLEDGLNMQDEAVESAEQEHNSQSIYLWIAGSGLVIWVVSLAADFALITKKGKAS